MDAEAFLELLEGLHGEAVREVVQSVRKGCHYDGLIAIGKLEAVEMIARRVKLSRGEPFELKRPICRMR